jgi:3-methyl-2-oxobutanoate hydroxymethyltransferase
MNAVHDFARAKSEGRRISMVAVYDAPTARIASRSNVDALLVGDSVAMVVHGHPTTLTASIEMMALHTSAVSAGAGGKFVIADLPFLACRKGRRVAMDAVGALVTSGANAVKVEGVDGHEAIVRHMVGSGVPVMGHIGLTPQSVNGLGGFRVQGRTDSVAQDLVRQAQALESLGCFAIVIECVPAAVAERVTGALSIPTIGIGAGVATDGQVLVLSDLLGIGAAASPRFVRRYLDGEALLTGALNRFDADVKDARFPSLEESYT